MRYYKYVELEEEDDYIILSDDEDTANRKMKLIANLGYNYFSNFTMIAEYYHIGKSLVCKAYV